MRSPGEKPTATTLGSEDLDAYGRWVTVPDYGPVWVPVVGPGLGAVSQRALGVGAGLGLDLGFV